MATSAVSLSTAGGIARASAGQSTIALFGRVLLAMLFVLSGLDKIVDPQTTLAYIKAAGLPFAPLALAGSALVELVGGTALILGFHTRLAAAVLAIFSVVAALFFHSHFADQNQMIHFLKNFAIAGGLLQVAAFGGGGFSLDGRGRRK
jgi:putative oxidoreductase